MFGGRFFEKGKTGCSFGKQRIFQSREKAKSSIMAGVVFVNDKKEDKPGVKVDVDSIITIKEMSILMSAGVDLNSKKR